MAEPYIGELRQFGFNFVPRGWASCDGQLLPITQNTSLFSLLGTIYGGDGRTTFALPDLRGRVNIHSGNGSSGPGLSTYRLGQRGGSETNTLTENQLPAHSHTATANCVLRPGDSNVASGKFWSTDIGPKPYHSGPSDARMNSAAIGIGNTGSGQSVPNVQPYLATNWCIALVGVFPSRS